MLIRFVSEKGMTLLLQTVDHARYEIVQVALLVLSVTAVL